MRGDEEGARSDARFVDRFDRFGKRLRGDIGSVRRREGGSEKHRSNRCERDIACPYPGKSEHQTASSNGHWCNMRARPKYTSIPAAIAATEASIGLRPVEIKIAIQPAIEITTGTG